MLALKAGSEEWLGLLKIQSFIGELMRMDRSPFVGHLLESHKAASLAA